MRHLSSQEVYEVADQTLRSCGASHEEASIVARHLVDSNLAGHDSHGVMRIIQYADEIDKGHIVPGSELEVIDDWDTGATFVGAGMFGQVACHEAMQRAIGKAKMHSMATVTIQQANHTGRLGTYAAQAAAANMVGLIMVNGGGAGQWVAPFGGRDRRLSTNPLAMGAPTNLDFPIVLDISTSIAPEGKVRDYLQRGESVPEGWLVDDEGIPTSDPKSLYAETPSALLPFGGSAGHKGFGLAFMVDIFAGALSSAGVPHRVMKGDPGSGSGVCMIVLNVERFAAPDQFHQQIQEMSAYVQSARPAKGFESVLVPGEYEYRNRIKRLEQGIPIPDHVWTQLNELKQAKTNP